MSVSEQAGPLITVGQEVPLGSATAVVGSTGASAGYITGYNANPDAGPNCIYAGNTFKDMRYRYIRGGGTENIPGGYAKQAVGFVDHQLLTLDFVPSAIATANLAALQVPTLNTAMTLVSIAGAGITITAAPITVLATGNVVPAGVLQIDLAPTWIGYGASGAIQGWSGVAAGRALSLTSGANLSAISFTIKGYDVYGAPMTQTVVGPNINTVNTLKGFKWVASITPNGTSASTVSIGTADIFEFPILARRFSQVEIWWNEAAVTSNTGFVTADVTNPATALTGDTRGSYAVQSASDGVKRLEVTQRILPADLTTLTSVFGVTQF